MPKKTWLFKKKRIYKYILKLIELCLAFSVANAKSKTGFFHLKRVENNDRSQIGEEPLSSLMEMATDESHMQNTTTRKLRKFLYNKKKSEESLQWIKTILRSESKKSNNYQSVLKTFQLAHNENLYFNFTITFAVFCF